MPERKNLNDKKISPVCLRLTFEERAKLQQQAGNMALSAYIRDQIFGDTASKRKMRGKNPVRDYEILAQILGMLGRSEMAAHLEELARAVKSDTLPVTDETADDIRRACVSVQHMRADLLTALGLHGQ